MNTDLFTWVNCVIALGSLFAGIGAICSAFLTQVSLRQQQANFERQSSDQQAQFEKQIAELNRSLTVQTTLAFESKFNDPRFRHARHLAATALLCKCNLSDADDVFDFFETLELFVGRGALDIDVAYSVFFHWINLYWRAGKHYIGSQRQDTHALWVGFERLFENVCNIERKLHPDSEDLKMPHDRLEQQLRGELEPEPQEPRPIRTVNLPY